MSRKLDQTNSWPPAVKELDSASTTLKEIRERGNPLSNSYEAILNIPDNERKEREIRNKKPLLTPRLRNAHIQTTIIAARKGLTWKLPQEGRKETEKGKTHLWGHNLRVLAFAKSLDTTSTNDLYMQQKLLWKPSGYDARALSPILFVKTSSPLPPQRPCSWPVFGGYLLSTIPDGQGITPNFS